MRSFKISAVYSIRNISNNKLYIGSATQYQNRKATHLSFLKRNNHQNLYLQRAFNKYGESNFEFTIIEIIKDKLKLIEREQVWIDFFKPEYNICKIAGSQLGFKHSKETKKLFSRQKRGKNNPNFGKLVSKERIEKFKNTRKINKEVNRLAYIKCKKNKMKPILQLNLENSIIQEFESIRDASRQTGYNRSFISQACKGNHIKAYGFKWKFKQ